MKQPAMILFTSVIRALHMTNRLIRETANEEDASISSKALVISGIYWKNYFPEATSIFNGALACIVLAVRLLREIQSTVFLAIET